VYKTGLDKENRKKETKIEKSEWKAQREKKKKHRNSHRSE
jgi:hypothetical protein